MAIGTIIAGAPSLKALNGVSTDDWVDRLSHVWTVFVFVLFAITVTLSQFVGEKIHCWCPAEFTSTFVDYANSYCWIKNTYYVPIDLPIPIEHQERESEELTYYQWVPLILFFQAFMFKFPNLVWRIFNSGSGINLEKLVDLAEESQMTAVKERESNIDAIAKYVDRWRKTNDTYHHNKLIRVKQKIAKFCCFFCNKRAGTYLTALYLFIKCLYVVNVISQFFILNAFLATNYHFYGFDVFNTLLNGGSWSESPRFPRVTLCDFKVRQLQNINTWTVQCVLPINLFNEKIFIFVWFWLVIVSALSCFNMVIWLYKISFKRNRPAYVKKYLLMDKELYNGYDKKMCVKFADTYLRDDGVFVIKVIAKNSTEVLAKDLVVNLFQRYKKQNDFEIKEKEDEDDSFMSSN